MEVNRELPNLDAGLHESVHLLTPGGCVLVLAYHSLEDRMVKQRFAEWSGTGPQPHRPRGLPAPEPATTPLVRVLTRRPIRPSEAETAVNLRAESARLRAAERL
jgi:16S rRNA (cytosine1402-N4)-methyltransferase